MGEQLKTIWTIGHSTRSEEEFISLLKNSRIKTLVDIRHYPGSRRYPHFNKDQLQHSLETNGINYIHLVDLGGRRKPLPGSVNNRWRHQAFRGYADYMGTEAFISAVQLLQNYAMKENTAYMCSEAVWWQCHRALVSDYLKIHGWQVLHIMSATKTQEHPYTSAARIKEGALRYDDPELFDEK